MKKINVLDCTLRDGGYINNWEFGKEVIRKIINNLENANIDIIECGFIRETEVDPDSSVFPSMDYVSEVINPKKNGVLYAIMIEQHNYVSSLVTPYSENTADIIRLTFRRNEWANAKKTVKELMGKGYKVCIQPVGTANYDDSSLIKLLQDVNYLRPYCFYLVDTLGLMYRHEMRKFFYLIDNNLSQNILLGFHSHNNLQMSFANAQEIMRLNRNRSIIIDSSCYGMGRGVGNLATELITDYINNIIEQKYSLIPILNIADRYLKPIYSIKRWGYDLPYFLSATFKCHPNYSAHLMQKETLSIESIEKILSLIPVDKRNEFNEDLIEKLYFEIQEYNIDDRESYEKLKKVVFDKEVLIIGPGSSIVEHKFDIDDVSSGKLIFSVNFIPEAYKIDALFISNEKRLGIFELTMPDIVVATSNLGKELADAWFFDYSSLLGEGDASDNSSAMLIRILKNCGIKKIYFAGLDGYDVDSSANFAISTFKAFMDYDTAKKKNKDISRQLTLALRGIKYEFITPTKYEIGNI